MNMLAVTILRWVEDSQPGWVECALADARGRTHLFREKSPVVSTEALNSTTAYPRSGGIAWEILSCRVDEHGRKILTVSTEKPWGCESTEGITVFEVLAEQLITEP